MATQDKDRQSPAEKKMHLIAGEIELTRNERIEFSQYLLRRDVKTWKNLSDEQVLRLLDAMEGYQLITALKEMR